MRLSASAVAILCLLGAGGVSAADTEALFAANFRDPSGKATPLAQWRGRPLIVNFWARWCVPCRKEIPELARVREQEKSRGLEVIGIGIEDNAEAVKDFAKAYDMDYPVLLSGDQGLALMRDLGNGKAGLPFTLVIDGQGRILQSKLGPLSGPELDRAVATLLP